MKGRKSSETLNQLLRELHMMRGSDMSQLLMRKAHDVLPFEDASMVESTSVKYDCSLFLVGSHQKKRPDNLILGRVFDGHILDMFETGIENYRGVDQFKPAEHITKDLKPILIFQGEPFDNSDKHQRLKSLLIGKSFH
jgi:ribosome production factor 2